MRCSNCQTINPEGARFCFNCGHALDTWRAEGERKQVTVLFADVVDSTGIAEQLDPEQVAELMNGAFAFLNSSIDKYGGTVARLMGDAVLALFGAPVAHEDDAERAVRVALEIQAAAKDYAIRVKREYGLDFRMRVGINTGLAVLDVVGDQTRTEYTAMGDTTNIAAKLQSAARPGTVLVSEDTYRLVKSAFEFNPLDPLDVKGKAAPVRIYEVLGPKAVRGQARGLEGLNSPLVGRDRERRLLEERVRDLHGGRGALVVIIGEAGLGKSRLVAELRKWSTAAANGAGTTDGRANPTSGSEGADTSDSATQSSFGGRVTWLEGRAISYGQSISYHPWQQIIRRSIGVQEEDSPSTVRDKLRTLAAGGGSALPPDIIPFLEAMLAVEGEDTQTALKGVPGEKLLQRITQAVRHLITAVGQAGPLIVVFDDLHWADEASLGLLVDVAGLVESRPVLFICLLRPDKGAASWPVLERLQTLLGERFHRVALEPLAPEHSRQLLGNLLRIEDLPESVKDLILKKAEGNPFFVEEVIRALIDSQHIVRVNSHWRATREIANVSIPNTLLGVLTARIDRLPDDTKRVMQMAAVLGRIFAYRVLKAICDSAPPQERIADIDPHLDKLCYEDLLRERSRMPELEYIFKHALTQDAAYNSLLIKRRKDFHRRAAAVLEQLYPERLDESAPVLALHFWEGEEWERAAEYSIRSGSRAAKVHALREALEHYERAIQALERIPAAPAEMMADAILGWTPIAYKISPRDAVLERLGRVEEIARRLNDKRRLAGALVWTANIHISDGYPSRALPLLSESYQLAKEVGEEILIVLPTYLMSEAMVNKDPRNALVQLEHVADLARKHNNLEIEVLATAAKALAHARLGDFDQANADIQHALQIAPSTNSLMNQADADIHSAFIYAEIGDAQRAIEYGQRGTERAITAKGLECACVGYFSVGVGHLRKHNWAEAEAAFQRSIEFSEFSGLEEITNQVHGGLAIARFFSGRTEAIKDIQSAVARARSLDDEYGVAFLSQALGEAYTQLGEHERAEEPLRAAIEYYRHNHMRPYLVRALDSLALLHDSQGRSADAELERAEARSLGAKPPAPAGAAMVADR